MQKKYTTALFDVDGTIVTLDGVIRAAQEALVHFGLKPMNDKDVIKRFMGHLIRDELPKIYPRIANQVDEIVAYYTRVFVSNHEKYEELQPYVRELFKQLKQNDVMIGIVTTKGRLEAIAVLDDYKIPYDVLISHNEVHAIKPNPEPITKALQELGVSPETALMTGDHVFDVLSARSAGCDSAGVLTGASTREELRQAGATYIINNLGQLPRILGLE